MILTIIIDSQTMKRAIAQRLMIVEETDKPEHEASDEEDANDLAARLAAPSEAAIASTLR